MDTDKLIHKYYSDNPQLEALLLLHSRCVRDKALEVVDKHPELNADRQFVDDAAMLHDIGIFRTNAPGIFCYGTEPYICHGLLGAAILRKDGSNSLTGSKVQEHFERLARVAERHTGTGLTRETIRKQGLPLPDVDFSPVTIEEQIVCYADKFYSKSHPERCKTTDQVREMLKKFPDANLERWDEWVKRFA